MFFRRSHNPPFKGNDPPGACVRPRRPSLHALTTLRPLLFLALSGLLVTGCRKDEDFTDDPGASLYLTEDTVLFDTVFTSIGSVTKRFVVRNDNDQAVRVDVALEGGTPSPYRINVDGASGVQFDKVEILGHDSIFVFVEVTIDPNNQNNPFLVQDHILLNTNGNEQRVLLIAWGQDAVYIKTDTLIQGFPAIGFIAREGQNVQWTNEKPYVIYGCYGVVDESATLTIAPGTRVYFHGTGSGLWVYKNGRIIAGQPGSDPNNRIIFQQDRLEATYDDLPNQWDRIWINEGDQDNEFHNCVIKNSLIGIQAQSIFTSGQPLGPNKLVLENVIIQNCATAGLYTENYRVKASNLLVADAGQYCAVLTGSGQYDFDHCTFANYWSFEIRQDPAFLLTDKFVNVSGGGEIRPIENSTFKNGIVYGNNTNEFQLDVDGGAGATFTFDRFLFKTDQSTDNSSGHFPNQDFIYRNQSPGFVDPSVHDLHLTEGAFARGRGISSVVTVDLDGRTYGADIDGVDIGCYEYVP